ncbi:MAG: glycosyltransferase [Ardenticatenaceae bacterium]|nr:glycosyltransferase [Ardenticatenaceae bacterium]
MFDVSVILPTYNRLSQLKHVLNGLEQQSYAKDKFEVVVVSDGSNDGTNEYLSNLQTAFSLKPLVQKNQGAAAARNTGIAAAAGEFALFIDDDVVPTPDLVQLHMQTHKTSQNDLIILGPMLTPADYQMAPWVAWEQEMLYKQYNDMQQGRWQPTARQFYTGNASLARKYLVMAGGFDTQFRRAEDVELAYRLTKYDLQFVFLPEAIGYHYANRSFRSWISTPYEYGRNDVIFSQKKGQDWLLPTIFTEFHYRQPLIQRLIHALLDRPNVSKWTVNGLKAFAQIGAGLRLPRLPRIAYSCIFNLKYYQGVSDELGGRASFFAGVEAHS